MRIFIFDDVRNIKNALLEAHFTPPAGSEITLVRPYIWNGMTVDTDYDNAFDTVLSNPVFDLWILDNDCGPGIEGFKFLQMMIEQHPEKMPKEVRSCSFNTERRKQIESYFKDWQRVQADAK